MDCRHSLTRRRLAVLFHDADSDDLCEEVKAANQQKRHGEEIAVERDDAAIGKSDELANRCNPIE